MLLKLIDDAENELKRKDHSLLGATTTMSKIHKLSGHKLLYKVGRPAQISMKKDFA